MKENLSRQSPVDVIVCGGGPAGVAAAVAAARAGAETRLIEMHGCLGGIWTAGLLAWVFEMDQPGLAMEIGRRLDAAGARSGCDYYKYSYDVESMKLLCEQLCLGTGVKVRLHTRLAGARVEGDGRLHSVITESKSGQEAWPAKIFVDCTGDGDLGAFSGCGFDMGGHQGETQPWTFMGAIAVNSVEAIKDCIYRYQGLDQHASTQRLLMDDLRAAGIDPSYGRPTIFHMRDNLCALMVNHEYGFSALNADDLTKATMNARVELCRIVEGLRSLGGKWEGLCLASTAGQIGVREARRIHGLYSLTADDVHSGASFPDGVCTCRFGVDIHSPDPKKDKGLRTEKVEPYQIPYRSLIAKDVKGLFMAGRCISGDWIAHASYRVTGTAVAMGEAAGTAAAISALSGRLPNEVGWSEIKAHLK